MSEKPASKQQSRPATVAVTVDDELEKEIVLSQKAEEEQEEKEEQKSEVA